MGGLLHLFDFHSNNVARKIFSQKSRDEDLEAPRNSFELQVENFQSYRDSKDTQLSYGFEEEWYERNCYPIEASTKKRIAQELSKRSNDKQTSPSIVAKLMGMDSLPLEGSKKSDKVERRSRRTVAAMEEMETESLNCERYERPKRREHPQEEELKRFKTEFEAWQQQAVKSKESSRIVEKRPPIHTDRRQQHDSEIIVPDQKERLFTRTRSFGREFNLKLSEKAATRIVVLKPGPQRLYEYEDSFTTSSGTMEESRGSIEEFLEEVKERLKSELKGGAVQRSSSVRGSGIETPFSEKPFSDYEHGANKANPVLVRSESTRSYASEVHCNASDSAEFVSRDTRKLLAGKLRNAMKRNGEITREEDREDTRSRSFGRGSDYSGRVSGRKDSSPRNLIRSLSAPVSGTSFGKLLLEDRHVPTTAQIRRKHEAAEQQPGIVDHIRRKERFNFRKKVSSFRSTLRGRIFGKKIRSMIESNSFEDEYIKQFVTGSRFTDFYDRNENSTEVPPSPASVCSSTPEEFWRNAEYLSPVSTPDVTIADENGVPRVFRDISSNLSELRRQIDELESNLQDDLPVEEEATQELELIDLGNPGKAYVRDLLVNSGLYDGTSERSSLFTWDPFAKTMNRSVFQETEEKSRKESNGEMDAAETDHNILFDLLNEALTVVLGPPMKNSSAFRRNHSCLMHPRGKSLLEAAWQIMSEYLYGRTEKPWCSLDGIISWDLETSPWTGLVEEQANVLGREVEGMVMADLVEELVKDLQHK